MGCDFGMDDFLFSQSFYLKGCEGTIDEFTEPFDPLLLHGLTSLAAMGE